jgi:hypothetical protein
MVNFVYLNWAGLFCTMKILFLILMLPVLSFGGVKMVISEGLIETFDEYNPLPNTTAITDSGNNYIEFTSSGVAADDAVLSATSKISVQSPPVGYIQWLAGGTANTFPTNDIVFFVSAPIADGTNSISQTSPRIIQSVTVSGTGTSADAVYYLRYNLGNNGKPNFYSSDLASILSSRVDGTWRLIQNDPPNEGWNNDAESFFPPKTGWDIGTDSSPAATISYDSLWVSSGEFATNTYADLVANPQGTNGVYIIYDSSSNITEIITYPAVLSAEDHAIVMNYITTPVFYPAPSTNGVPAVDLSGFDAFDIPPTDIIENSSAPAISEWTRQGDSGDTIAISGENL